VDAGVDIVNFDAFQFGETVALYPEQMRTHLVERKNALAWGVAPTSTAIRNESVSSLVERFERLTEYLAEKTQIDKGLIVEQSFITPSCGTGSMEVADAERVFDLLGQASQQLRKNHGFA
jgi:hypothetical protein